MPLSTSNLNHLWASLLVEALVRQGVTCFFVAPGSRSTPLTTAIARHPRARCTLHVDERGGAFAALGYGRATGHPAGWVTTSGTAVANGLPAAVEAATDGVPMLLLTADRPPEKRDTGANQTIDQVGLFGAYARWAFDVPAPTTAIAPQMLLTTAAQAVHFARRVPPGPVHLNCMFRKPLHPEDDGVDYAAYLSGLEAWRSDDRPYTQRPVATPNAPSGAVEACAMALRGKRGLVVCGRLGSEAEAEAAVGLAEALGWPLVPDATSRLRLRSGPPVVPHADQALVSEAFREASAVEAVLHLGGRSVSKRLRLFLRDCRPRPYVVARPDARRLDPDHGVTQHIETDVAAFCEALQARATSADGEGGFGLWRRAGAAVRSVLDDFADGADELSEPLVARLVSRHGRAGDALVLGSSMPVRDFNRYAQAGEAGAVGPRPVFANRGASGIDGTMATAAGVSEGRPGEAVTLLLGDLAALHDLNALALLADRPVTVVAINNGGGGIFHFLPISEHADVFEPHFTTPHGLSFAPAAEMFGLGYEQPRTPAAFVDAYQRALRRGGPTFIEVRTEREANRALHEALEQRIAAAVDGTV